MIEERSIKTILYIYAALTFLTYLFFSEALPSVLNISFINATHQWFKIFSFTISSILGIIFIGTVGLAKLVLRNKYIGGTYQGKSLKISREQEIIAEHVEIVQIIQSLVSIKISGESRAPDNILYAQWEGFAIKTTPETNNYEFVAKIKTNTGEHMGFFEFNITDGQLKGYHPVRNSKWQLELSRKE